MWDFVLLSGFFFVCLGLFDCLLVVIFGGFFWFLLFCVCFLFLFFSIVCV